MKCAENTCLSGSSRRLALLPVLLLALAACGGNGETPTTPQSSAGATPDPTAGSPTSTVVPTATTAPLLNIGRGSAETDREALLALYNAMDGPNWDNNSGWLSSAPIGEWFGVTTVADDRVITLALQRNQLSGEIPPELGNLANLEDLHLGDNQLIVCMPHSLRRLHAMSDLPLCGE